MQGLCRRRVASGARAPSEALDIYEKHVVWPAAAAAKAELDGYEPEHLRLQRLQLDGDAEAPPLARHIARRRDAASMAIAGSASLVEAMFWGAQTRCRRRDALCARTCASVAGGPDAGGTALRLAMRPRLVLCVCAGCPRPLSRAWSLRQRNSGSGPVCRLEVAVAHGHRPGSATASDRMLRAAHPLL